MSFRFIRTAARVFFRFIRRNRVLDNGGTAEQDSEVGGVNGVEIRVGERIAIDAFNPGDHTYNPPFAPCRLCVGLTDPPPGEYDSVLLLGPFYSCGTAANGMLNVTLHSRLRERLLVITSHQNAYNLITPSAVFDGRHVYESNVTVFQTVNLERTLAALRIGGFEIEEAESDGVLITRPNGDLAGWWGNDGAVGLPFRELVVLSAAVAHYDGYVHPAARAIVGQTPLCVTFCQCRSWSSDAERVYVSAAGPNDQEFYFPSSGSKLFVPRVSVRCNGARALAMALFVARTRPGRYVDLWNLVRDGCLYGRCGEEFLALFPDLGSTFYDFGIPHRQISSFVASYRILDGFDEGRLEIDGRA